MTEGKGFKSKVRYFYRLSIGILGTIAFWALPVLGLRLVVASNSNLIHSAQQPSAAAQQPSATAQAQHPEVVRVGDHFTPYGNFISSEKILEGETDDCWTAIDQPCMIVEKIVGGYTRVRYVPQLPYETGHPRTSCHPGSTFKISVDDLLRWRRYVLEAHADEALREQLLSK